jgi:bacterioferritin-associated ferredoxin
MWICLCQQINDKKLADLYQESQQDIKKTLKSFVKDMRCGMCVEHAKNYLSLNLVKESCKQDVQQHEHKSDEKETF